MLEKSIGSRTDHHIWPDGSVSIGSPIMNYAQACAAYEKTRRKLKITDRVTLEQAEDFGFIVSDSWNNKRIIRATPGNVYPHPMMMEEKIKVVGQTFNL